MSDYDRFLSMYNHVREQLNNIDECCHSLKVSPDVNDACNLMGEALSKLEDVADLITEAYEI